VINLDLITKTDRERLIQKINDFEKENLTEEERGAVRRMEWPFVEMYIYLALTWLNLNIKQLKRLIPEDLLELAVCLAERAQIEHEESQSFWKRFLVAIRCAPKPDPFLEMVRGRYLSYFESLKRAYGKDLFPHSKFKYSVSEFHCLICVKGKLNKYLY